MSAPKKVESKNSVINVADLISLRSQKLANAKAHVVTGDIVTKSGDAVEGKVETADRAGDK